MNSIGTCKIASNQYNVHSRFVHTEKSLMKKIIFLKHIFKHTSVNTISSKEILLYIIRYNGNVHNRKRLAGKTKMTKLALGVKI